MMKTYDAMDREQKILVSVEAQTRDSAIKKIEATLTEKQRKAWERAHRLIRYFDPKEVKKQ